jgi:DNA-binding NarL/FixJ family response regulator
MTAADLTPAERDVLERMLSGQYQHQVAEARGTSRSTVQRQLDYLRAKVGVRTLLQLGAWAERHGIREQGAVG